MPRRESAPKERATIKPRQTMRLAMAWNRYGGAAQLAQAAAQQAETFAAQYNDALSGVLEANDLDWPLERVKIDFFTGELTLLDADESGATSPDESDEREQEQTPEQKAIAALLEADKAEPTSKKS